MLARIAAGRRLGDRSQTRILSIRNRCSICAGSISSSACIETAIAARNLQISHSDLADTLSVIRYPVMQGGLAEQFGMPTALATEFLDREVNRQALMISYLDSFWLMSVMTFALLPLILLLRVQKDKSANHEPMVIE